MELAIVDKKENPALQRTEISCHLSYEEAMPSRKEIREALCAAAGVAPEQLLIIFVRGGYGSNRAAVLAHAYKSKEAMAVERKHLLIRDGLAQKEQKKPAAQPKK